MPPMIIFWVLAGTFFVGSLAGFLTYFATSTLTTIVFTVAAIIVILYLIPFLPDRYAFTRKLKRVMKKGDKNE
ncbi:hypothetical protein FJM67_08140 [Maribrevibacterium harenarium]|uniref:Uncharacterized protein n=1 Tax=Maribrevibacterium harenarium TaxID=2589817 RepID=A0A501WU45_9GAMM|nr:hypothetical protein [Maribrevibacterium harenarium]TPE51940.1 hypothetical protein FJM67_08140 [Maribrevibacterium harenarium]